jgi:hypothetical protein
MRRKSLRKTKETDTVAKGPMLWQVKKLLKKLFVLFPSIRYQEMTLAE